MILLKMEIASRGNVLTFSPNSPLRILAEGLIGFDGGAAEISSEACAFGLGTVMMGRSVLGREMKIRFEIDVESSEEDAEWRRRIQRIAAPAEECVITAEAFGMRRQITAVAAKVEFGRDKEFEHTEAELWFRASVPFFEETEAVVGTISAEDGGSVVANAGDAACGAVFTVRAVGGTVVKPSVVLGEHVIRILESLSDGDELVIDTRFGRKGVWLNGEEHLTFDLKSSFFSLAVGENVVSADADEGKEFMAVSYEVKPLYFGI